MAVSLDNAQKVMRLAAEEARRLDRPYVGTEHILLALVKDGSGVAANVLLHLDVDFRRARRAVETLVQPAPEVMTGASLPQTPRARKVIEHAIEEACDHDRHEVGTEHLLLGLLHDTESVAGQVLKELGVKLADVRETLRNFLRPCAPQPAYDLADSEGSAAADALDLPADIRQAVDRLEAQIEWLNLESKAALAVRDFDRAVQLRGQANKLATQRYAVLRNWHTRYVIDPAWLSCNGGTVAKVARAIRADRCWEELPVLADALEEAGCTNDEILEHCRQAGEHGRRCWAIDLLTGRA
jgi:ATP-dependent Clp protease ATP-binding subunit ClpA